MKWVDKGISLIPYKEAAVWKEFFFNPTETIKKNDKSILGRLGSLYLVEIIAIVIEAIAMLPALLIAMPANALGSGIIIMIAGAMVLAALVLGPILDFLYSLLEYAVAKALGGTGSIRANFNASALPGLGAFVVLLPLTVAEIPFMWLRSVPIVGIVFGCLTFPFSIAAALVGLYSLYPKYLAFKEVHTVSDLRAAAIVFVPVIILVIAAILLMVMFYATVLAVFMAGMHGTK